MKTAKVESMEFFRCPYCEKMVFETHTTGDGEIDWCGHCNKKVKLIRQ